MTILTRTLGLGGQNRAGGSNASLEKKQKNKIQKTQFWDTRALHQSSTCRIFFFFFWDRIRRESREG